jgi:CBS domain-containing protein
MSEEVVTRELVLARDVMSRPVRRLVYGTPVADAAAFFLRHGISGAPVTGAEGRPVGVFTMSDLSRSVQRRWLRHASGRTLEGREPLGTVEAPGLEGLEKMTVGQLMTPGLFTVFPEATLEEVVRTMSSQKIHRVFVISEKGDLEGVITMMDVLHWTDRKFAAQKEEDRAHHRS